jgi:L-iditol 2-dehydrogenase
MQPGKTVLVIGSGIAGLMHVMLARATGARRIVATDISRFRLDAARRLGADMTYLAEDYQPDLLRQVNQGQLADLVIVCAGASPAITQALKSVERAGTVLFFAPTGPGVTVPLSINDLFWRNDITLKTSYAGSPADYQTALDLIQTGTLPIREMITHRLSLAETGHGFQLVAAAQDSLKVIIEPQR